MIGGTKLALGLMSGTSLDGIDIALLKTNGIAIGETGFSETVPYPQGLREQIRSVLGGNGAVHWVETEMTLFHAELVKDFLAKAGNPAVDVIGFHGHTILHQPERMRSWQIGDGALLAKETGIPVVNDFRSADVALGGQGAPLMPAFHAAMAAELLRPIAVLNLGGVANVTWVGEDNGMLAFDTGPGNALIDDWMLKHTGAFHDEGGKIAASGQIDREAVDKFGAHHFFSRKPPKSLDRDEFRRFAGKLVEGKSVEDGAATLTAFTVAAIQRGSWWFPKPVHGWLVAGGGRHNVTLMTLLREGLDKPVEPVEKFDWNGDALEAQGFAYLAVRSLLGLPLSWPGTTGVPRPVTGGRLHRPPQ